MKLTPSHLIQYLYCPRFTYFEYVLRVPQYEEKHYKVIRGREIHLRKTKENKAYLRKKLGVKSKYIDQYLSNDVLRGQVDEIIELPEGLAPLDYKFAQYKERVFDTYRTQIHCYAWLIMDQFKRPVKNGYLVYTRSDDKVVEVPVTAADIDRVKERVDRVLYIIEGNIFPEATKNKQKCLTCTYRNICPK